MTLTALQPMRLAGTLVALLDAEGTASVVTLRGEADIFALPVVVDALSRAIAAGEGPVIVDLAQTDFIDTATVRALARARNFLRDDGRALTVRSPSRMAARVLSFFGLDDTIESDRTPST